MINIFIFKIIMCFNMKKVIFTESQIRSILNHLQLNEDDLYLDTTEDGNYPDENSIPFNLGQITVSNGDSEEGGEPTTDKIAAMHKQTPYGGFRRGIYENKKKVVTESNQDLDRGNIKFSPLQRQQLQQAINNCEDKTVKGYDRMNNWLKAGKISYADAYRTLRDHQDGDYNEESILPDEFISFLKSKIGSAKMTSNVRRNSKTDANKLVNANKTPNTKQGTGKGHHEGEQLNNGTVHYF